MYNLTVDTAHTYFVGAGQWLVHNTGGCPVNFDPNTVQVQAKFKHAEDFGISENYNPSTASQYVDALTDHISQVGTEAIEGTYRGTQQVTHYFNRETRLNIMADLKSNFISGWKLGQKQIEWLLKTGNIK